MSREELECGDESVEIFAGGELGDGEDEGSGEHPNASNPIRMPQI